MISENTSFVLCPLKVQFVHISLKKSLYKNLILGNNHYIKSTRIWDYIAHSHLYLWTEYKNKQATIMSSEIEDKSV